MAKGDVDAQVEANQNLARLAIEEERIKLLNSKENSTKKH